MQASFPMQAHDGWVCRDPFGVGSTVCFAQCATFSSAWPGHKLKPKQQLFQTVSKASIGNKSSNVEPACPSGYTMMSGGRAIEFANVWDNSTKDFDINEVSFLLPVSTFASLNCFMLARCTGRLHLRRACQQTMAGVVAVDFKVPKSNATLDADYLHICTA